MHPGEPTRAALPQLRGSIRAGFVEIDVGQLPTAEPRRERLTEERDSAVAAGGVGAVQFLRCRPAPALDVTPIRATIGFAAREPGGNALDRPQRLVDEGTRDLATFRAVTAVRSWSRVPVR